MLPLFNQSLYDRAEQIAPNYVGQLRSDIARYEILKKYGGVYIDIDFECLRPLDSLLVDVESFAAWEEDGKWVNNAILGCRPNNPLIHEIIHRIPHRIATRPGQRPNRLTGPHLLTQVYNEQPQSLTVFPKVMFYPYLYNELHRGDETFPNSYAVHHWNNARRKLVK